MDDAVLSRVIDLKSTAALCTQLCPVFAAKKAGVKTTIQHAADGWSWSLNRATKALGRSGTPVTWSIMTLPNLYKADQGRVNVAWDEDVSQSATHEGYVMWIKTTQDSSSNTAYNFAYCFVPTGAPNTYYIGNDYTDATVGPRSWVGFDATTGRIRIVRQIDRVAWKLDAPLPVGMTRPQFPS